MLSLVSDKSCAEAWEQGYNMMVFVKQSTYFGLTIQHMFAALLRYTGRDSPVHVLLSTWVGGN